MAIFNRKKLNKEEDTPKGSNSPQYEAMSPEEQMLRHQSAPRPTAESEAHRLYQMQMQRMMQGQGMNAMGAMDGFKALAQVIGKEQVQKASLTLQKYKEGKANLEKRIVDNEQWYKIRHWECMRDKTQQVQPTSAWLFNCILSKRVPTCSREKRGIRAKRRCCHLSFP